MSTLPSIAFCTTLQPETHYSRYLIGALQQRLERAALVVYADQDRKNASVSLKNVELAWNPTYRFPFQIASRAAQQAPSVVHLQHEINMYGGPSTAVLFPILLLLLRLRRQRIVVTVHSVVPTSAIDAEFMRTFSWRPSAGLVLAVKVFFSFLYRSIGLLSDRVIVHSEYMAGLLQRDYGVPRRKVVSIPIGVPSTDSSQNPPPNAAGPWAATVATKKLILYFGYVIRRKGLEYLIDAFQKLAAEFPDYALVVAGGELDYQKDYAAGLRREVESRCLQESIVFTSFISAAQIERLFASCEFVVLPYTYSISSSLPLSFAMEYGKPVIATRLGTLEEEIEDGKTGLLVPPRDAPALEEAMRRLMADEALRGRLAQGALEKGRRRSWLAIADQTIQVYQAVDPRLVL